MTTTTNRRWGRTGMTPTRLELPARPGDGASEPIHSPEAASNGPEGLAVDPVDTEWTRLPGGELEVPRPHVRCAACRAADAAAKRAIGWPGDESPICFECYRTDRARERALLAAKHFHTGSPARFAEARPFEPVNRARLARLRAERLAVRRTRDAVAARFVDRRRSAQVSARHALQVVAEGLRARSLPSQMRRVTHVRHALPLPDSWLPFVASH